MSRPPDMLQGMLDLLILRVLQHEPMHGWAIGNRIRQLSDEVLQVQQGSLYPALHKLEEQGWIEATWGESENRRRAKFYTLTAAGRRRVTEETAHWQRLSAAIALVVRTT
ncbi:PadR family transcriptional regulator [Luteitalea sp.]